MLFKWTWKKFVKILKLGIEGNLYKLVVCLEALEPYVPQTSSKDTIDALDDLFSAKHMTSDRRMRSSSSTVAFFVIVLFRAGLCLYVLSCLVHFTVQLFERLPTRQAVRRQVDIFRYVPELGAFSKHQCLPSTQWRVRLQESSASCASFWRLMTNTEVQIHARHRKVKSVKKTSWAIY